MVSDLANMGYMRLFIIIFLSWCEINVVENIFNFVGFVDNKNNLLI